MPTINLTTEIKSTIEICFDLARSIDLHIISTAYSNEQAVAGKTSGLIGLNEYVTWQATHLGVKQKLTSRITAFERPFYFVDEQVNGAFKSFYHKHTFTQMVDKVVMQDTFQFEAPLGILGQIFNRIFLTGYMKKLLLERNLIIKEYAETNKWQMVLNEETQLYNT